MIHIMEHAPQTPSQNQQPLENIILVGFMGSGKSSLGRELHQNLGYQLIDTDHVIEKQTGKSIPDIFSQDGEAAFRNLETELLKQLISQKTSEHIISTGGGVICIPENRTMLRKLGFVVWLECSVKDIFERTAKNKNRPLLQCDDPMQAIKTLLQERSPYYEETAHLKINTTGLSLNEVSCGILESARYYFGSA
jgi:shikimate kinase